MSRRVQIGNQLAPRNRSNKIIALLCTSSMQVIRLRLKNLQQSFTKGWCPKHQCTCLVSYILFTTDPNPELTADVKFSHSIMYCSTTYSCCLPKNKNTPGSAFDTRTNRNCHISPKFNHHRIMLNLKFLQALKISLTYQNNNHSHTANCLTTKGIQRQQQIRTKRSLG